MWFLNLLALNKHRQADMPLKSINQLIDLIYKKNITSFRYLSVQV